MRWNDMKYVGAYLGPIIAFLSVWQGGFWSFSAAILSFVIIPLVELLLGNNQLDHVPPIDNQRESLFFDMLLYLNVPILYGLIILFFWRVGFTMLDTYEIIGMTLSVGTYVGASGINVAHELGHRSGRINKLLAQLLLIPGFYQHFTIEHNHGHHRWVGTLRDPATARYGENIYRFWIRSSLGSIRNAISIEMCRLEKSGISIWSWRNQILQYCIVQIIYLVLVFIVFGSRAGVLAVAIGLIGFLLLESINYIEHYGLLRKRKGEDQFERVGMMHSWNSNHDIGRIFLYELTRHADHHYKASKKYQFLRHIAESPQLPTGYPGSIILALIPPMWFRIMNPKVPVDMVKLFYEGIEN